MLETLGIDPEAEEVYRAMLRFPGAPAPRVAEHLGWTGAQVRAAQERLARSQLLTRADGGDWATVPPERAVESLIERQEADLEERRRRLLASRENLPDLVAEYVGHRRHFADQRLEVLDDPPLVRSRLYQLVREVETTVWTLQPGPALSPQAVEAALPNDRALAQAGRVCRLVVSAVSLEAEHWRDYLVELERLGHEVRVATTLAQRCLIVDFVHAVVPTTDGASPGAYLLHGTALVAPLVRLFEEVWARSEPLAHALSEAAAHPDDRRLREVSELLARGLKDEAVARRLGVSPRTMRRLVAALFEELGAESRYQAGAVAARRGWVPEGTGADAAPGPD